MNFEVVDKVDWNRQKRNGLGMNRSGNMGGSGGITRKFIGNRRLDASSYGPLQFFRVLRTIDPN